MPAVHNLCYDKGMPLLYNLFPPPKFLDFPIAGVDVSDRSIKFVELAETKEGIRLKRFGKKDLAPGVIVAGEIKKSDELSSLLAAIFKPLKIGHIVAAMPEERAYISIFQLPEMARKEMRSAIEVELAESIPLPANEAIFDFEILPAVSISKEAVITEDNPLHRDAVVYAFPKQIVQNYLDAYLNAGLKPAAFTMETLSLSRALLPAGKTAPPTMIVDFGKTRTSFVIVAEGLVRFSSTVAIAGEDLDKALVKTLNISFSRAEELKKKKGLVMDENNKEVYNALLPVVSAVSDEIQRHILFWNSHAEHVHKSSPNISKIILTGGDANLIGIEARLSQNLSLPVMLGNSWLNVAPFEEYIPEISFNQSLTFSAAIGLALKALSER